MAIDLEKDFGEEKRRFQQTLGKFTEQTEEIRITIGDFSQVTKKNEKIVEKLSKSLQDQLELLNTNVSSVTDSIFRSDKPFLIDSKELNEKIGKAQGIIDVLSAKIEDTSDQFAKLTDSEKEAIRAQIASARKLVETTEAFGFGARQVLETLKVKSLSSIEDFTLNQVGNIPLIGNFLSGFLRDSLQILKARRAERLKVAKEQLVQEAKEKAARDDQIDAIVRVTNITREEAENRILEERERQAQNAKLQARQEELDQLKRSGLISETEYKGASLQKTKIDDKPTIVELNDESITELGGVMDNVQQGITEGLTQNLTKNIGTSVAGAIKTPIKSLQDGMKAAFGVVPDPSRMTEMKNKEKFDLKDKLSEDDVNKEEKGGLGFLGLTIAGISTALSMAALKTPLILAGGAAIGGGLGLILGLGGIGAGIGAAATGLGLGVLSSGLTKLSPTLDDFIPKVKQISELNGEALKESAEGIGALGGALSKFALGGLAESMSSVVQGITGLFVDSPMEKLEKFGELGDDVQMTADALEDATPKLEKFYNMLAGKDFSNLAGFTTFTEEFLEGSQNIVRAFKGGRNIVTGFLYTGLEDIKVDSIDQVRGLIDSVTNLGRVTMINDLTAQNKDLSSYYPQTQPIVSTNVVNQSNSQGVVMNHKSTNDNLDAKIIEMAMP